MPVDPALVAETRDWLIKANEDLQASELLSKGALPALAAFHAQQAAEKALKAFLTWHDHDFLKTHDLDILSDDCVAIDSTLATVSSAVSPISRYAVESRYPGVWPNPTAADARQAFKLARAVYDAVISRLPAQVKS
jgi:HEPN domain-containing protein